MKIALENLIVRSPHILVEALPDQAGAFVVVKILKGFATCLGFQEFAIVSPNVLHDKSKVFCDKELYFITETDMIATMVTNDKF